MEGETFITQIVLTAQRNETAMKPHPPQNSLDDSLSLDIRSAKPDGESLILVCPNVCVYFIYGTRANSNITRDAREIVNLLNGINACILLTLHSTSYSLSIYVLFIHFKSKYDDSGATDVDKCFGYILFTDIRSTILKLRAACAQANSNHAHNEASEDVIKTTNSHKTNEYSYV